MNKVVKLSDPANGANDQIALLEPYCVSVEITGVADIIFHRWDPEAIDEKSRAAKGSAAKKTDNLESYVYRDGTGNLCLPGEYLRMAVVQAAKYRQDPRSPRKSAMDLYKAGFVVLTILASLGTDKWDYEDRRRVVIQRNGVNRTRPAMHAGWKVVFEIMVNTPEYISQSDLHDVLNLAGRLVGIGNFRPTYGRFNVTNFQILKTT